MIKHKTQTKKVPEKVKFSTKKCPSQKQLFPLIFHSKFSCKYIIILNDIFVPIAVTRSTRMGYRVSPSPHRTFLLHHLFLVLSGEWFFFHHFPEFPPAIFFIKINYVFMDGMAVGRTGTDGMEMVEKLLS